MEKLSLTKYLSTEDLKTLSPNQLANQSEVLDEAIEGIGVIINTSNSLGDISLASDMRLNLRYAKKNKDRVKTQMTKKNVFIDGEFAIISLN